MALATNTEIEQKIPDQKSELELPSERIVEAASRFVEAKHLLDKLSHSKAGRLVMSRNFDYMYPYEEIPPSDAVSTLLPFYKFERACAESSEQYQAMVPTHLTIGQSWRWHPVHFHGDESKKFAHDPAQYVYIKPLGIVVAHEGKNRVALFRERQRPYIPAKVWEASYPKPDRLRIFDNGNLCLAILDDRYVEIVADWQMIKELYIAYGVSIEVTWPTAYPSLLKVLQKLYIETSHSFQESGPVDMVALQIDDNIQNTPIRVSLSDIDVIDLPILKIMCASVLVAIFLMFLSDLLSEYRELKGALKALSFCATVVCCLPVLRILKCKVQYTKKHIRLPATATLKTNLSSKTKG